MCDPYQLSSWCDAYGRPPNTSLVGQIYFATDTAYLDSQDVAELNKLRSPFSLHLLGRRGHFQCVGHTDHRGGSVYNEDLGRRRAAAVKRKLDALFGHLPLYSSAPAVSRGELEAQWPLPSREQMAADRRVDVVASRNPNRTNNLAPFAIAGRLPPEIRITEVQSTGPAVSDWMPSNPGDTPDDLTNPPGDQTN